MNLILQLQSFNCDFILTTLKLGKIRLVILEQHLYTVYIPVLWIRSFYLKTLCILLALWSKCLVVIELEKRCLVFFSLLLVCLNLKEECYLEVPKSRTYISNYFCYSKVMWPDYQVLKTVYSKGALKPKWSSKNIDIHLKTRGFTRWNQT